MDVLRFFLLHPFLKAQRLLPCLFIPLSQGVIGFDVQLRPFLLGIPGEGLPFSDPSASHKGHLDQSSSLPFLELVHEKPASLLDAPSTPAILLCSEFSFFS